MRQSKNKKAARDKADKYFSLYIRKQAATTGGYCQCVTCGKWKFWKQIDCGHWQRRGYEGTRYDQRNAAPQCRHCNYYRQGKPEIFEDYIRQKYGQSVVNELKWKAKARTKRKQKDYEWIAKEYKEKIDNLEPLPETI